MEQLWLHWIHFSLHPCCIPVPLHSVCPSVWEEEGSYRAGKPGRGVLAIIERYSVVIQHQQSSNHHRSSSQGTVALIHGMRVFLGYCKHSVVCLLFMVPSFSHHESVSPRTRSVLEASSSEARSIVCVTAIVLEAATTRNMATERLDFSNHILLSLRRVMF